MRHLKKYEKLNLNDRMGKSVDDVIGPTFHKETDIKIRQMYPDSWKDLQIYRMVDIDKLFKIYSFERRFDETLQKCLKDVFGQNCLASGEVKIDESRKKGLVLLLINGLNWYCFLKKLYDKQINLPWLRVMSERDLESICWSKNFQKGLDTFFEYMWGFRSALFCKNDIKHRDVLYLQKNVYTKIYNDDFIKRHKFLDKPEPMLGGL